MHRISTALICFFLVPVPPSLHADYAAAGQLWRFDAPLTEQQRARTSISAAAGSVWLLHPDGFILRREERSGGRDDQERVQTVTTRRIDLPIRSADEPADLHLRLIAVSPGNAWLIDLTGRRMWFLSHDRWSPQRLAGEPVGGAAADGHRLVVNTPANTAHAFAAIRPDGTVERRFGSRLTPPRNGLDVDWNRWSLALLPDGRLIAAHRYSPLMRSYDPDGSLLREWQAPGPEAARLARQAADAIEAIRVDPATCCWEAKLVVFATRVVPTSAETFAVQYGTHNALEEFDGHGRWMGSTPLRIEGPLVDAAPADDALAIVSTRGAALYRRAPRQRIDGTVTSSRRRPVADATVSASTASGTASTVQTDEAGRFTLYVTNPLERHKIAVSAPGFRTATSSGPIRDIAAKAIVLLPLLRQCVEVYDAVTREPIDTFEVTLAREEQEDGRRRQTVSRHPVTAPSGRTCVDVPFDPPWLVSVSSPGYAMESAQVTDRDVGRSYSAFLSRGAVLELTARERAGTPADGVMLRLIPSRSEALIPPNREQTGVTDAAGRARFEGLREGHFRLEASSDRFMPFDREISLTSPVQFEEIELEPGATLRVTVESARGALEGALVTLEPVAFQARRSLQCRTDANGTCSIAALAPGRYAVRARAEGLGNAFRPVDISDGDQEVELRLEEVLRLTGTIENRSEYPDLDLEVFASRPGFAQVSSPVDSAGAFAMEGAPTGTVNIRVWERNRNSGLLFQRITVPAGQTSHHVMLRLPPPATLSGRVRHHGTGCGSCSVVARRAGAEVDLPAVRARVEPTGHYSARLPGAGTYVVRAESRDGTVDQKVVEIRTATVLDFDLDSGRVAVSVRGPEGASVSGARVLAVDVPRGITVADLVTDDRGIASLPELASPTRITATQGRAAGSLLHPGSGGSRAVEITLRHSSGIMIDIRDRSGAPVYRATARVRSSRSGADSGPQELIRTGEEPFELLGDPADVLDIVIGAPRYAPKTIHGVTGSGPHRVILSGGLTVAILTGVAIEPCAIQFLDAGGMTYGISPAFPLGPVPLTTREAVFNPIEAGDYTVVLYTCSGEVLRRTVSVAPGTITPLVAFD